MTLFRYRLRGSNRTIFSSKVEEDVGVTEYILGEDFKILTLWFLNCLFYAETKSLEMWWPKSDQPFHKRIILHRNH